MTIESDKLDRWLEALRRGREALEAENKAKKPIGWARPKDEYQGDEKV